ncbi:hypothetical protein HMPREF1039_0537 [Megasphaera lornae]|uniref:PAS domain-containing protein n=1 Tax=Megasphaera lornae TaxID=1000568 RepID=A0ABP2L2F8_9FIRM|nr:PAS domain-containing protein [Megasphaera lornae]EGL39227.1 hypothetical protein HMPREF1039_0537 [Megasphaera lornae]
MLKKMLSPQTEQPFFWIIVILLAVIAVYNWIISLLALILSIGAYLLTRKNSNERNLAMQQLLDSISQGVDQASTYAVQNLPIGIAIVDMQGTICWANSVFRDWVGELDAEQQLKQILPNLNLDKFWGKFGSFFETMRERQYRVVYKYLQTEEASEDNYLILYFEDISETETQKRNCLQTVPAFCDIEIDNMEEVSKGLSAVQQATLWTNVNNCLLDELTALGGFVRSYGNAKYFACLTHKALQTLQADNFSFLKKFVRFTQLIEFLLRLVWGLPPLRKKEWLQAEPILMNWRKKREPVWIWLWDAAVIRRWCMKRTVPRIFMEEKRVQ